MTIDCVLIENSRFANKNYEPRSSHKHRDKNVLRATTKPLRVTTTAVDQRDEDDWRTASVTLFYQTMGDTRKDFNYFQTHCQAIIDAAFKVAGKRGKRKFKAKVMELDTQEKRLQMIAKHESFKEQLDLIRSIPVYTNAKDKLIGKETANLAFELYNGNKLRESLSKYSEAIVYLPFPEDDPTESNKQMWVHCFAQRGIIYYKLNKLANAILDLDEAIKYANETSFKVLLIWYKTSARKSLEKMDNPSGADIQLSSHNPILESASDDIELMVDPVKGRTVVSKGPLQAGTLVVAQPAFCSWLRPSLFTKHCNHCLKSLDDRCFPCRKCSEVRYCSWNCAEKAWSKYHSVECSYLGALKNLVFGLMGIRAMLVFGVDNMINYYLSESKNDKIWEGEPFGDSLRAMTSLVAEMQHKDEEFEFEVLIGALLMSVWAEKMGVIKKKDPHYFTFASVLRKSILQVLLNCFYVYEETIRHSGIFDIYVVDPNYYDIGFAVYSTASMFSHSCKCNANRVFIGNTIYIHLNQDVDDSEEITIDYGADTYHNSVKYRRHFLKNSFGFECQCKPCLTGIENVHYAFRCPCGGLLINDGANDVGNYCLSCKAQNLKISGPVADIKTADGYYKKAEKRMGKNKIRNAKAYFKKAMKIYEKTYCSKMVGKDIYACLVSCYLTQKKYSMAGKYCETVLDIVKEINGKQSFDYANLCFRLVDIRLKEMDVAAGGIKGDPRVELAKLSALFKEAVDIVYQLQEREVNITNKANIKYFGHLKDLESALVEFAESFTNS